MKYKNDTLSLHDALPISDNSTNVEEGAMAKKVVPMIHVPDVRATVDWYQGIGFTVTNTYGNDSDGLSFAILSFGDRKSTRLNSSHRCISYAVFCLKKKK